MKKRYVDANRIRKLKRNKIAEGLSESALTFLKFLVAWLFILVADFILEFRFEYLWPCWLFIGSVYTFFHCHGLVICVFFACAVFTLDVFCLIFVPVDWLVFAASSYVWCHYVWHTERRICFSSLSVWSLFLYVEATFRFKDLKSVELDLLHFLSAHCIGFPVVYFGFDATCYITSIVKLKIQKEVQTENDFYVQLLQQALPTDQHIFLRYEMDCKDALPKWMTNTECLQHQHPNGESIVEKKCLLSFMETELKERGKDTEAIKQNSHVSQALLPAANKTDKDNCLSKSLTWELFGSTESLPQEDTVNKSSKNCKPPSPKTQRMVSSSVISAVKSEKKQKCNMKPPSPNRETSENGLSGNQNFNNESMLRIEQDMKKLKADLQVSKQNEQDLRNQLCYQSNCERNLRTELSQLRQENELLQNKVQYFIQAKQKDKHNINQLEKRLRAEADARAILEKQLSDMKLKKAEETTTSARPSQLTIVNRQESTDTLKNRIKELENEYKQIHVEVKMKDDQIRTLEGEMEVLCRYRDSEQDAEILLSALTAMQDKTQHLETSLSAETRIKLDLFSALGDARRQLEIAQGKIMKQDQEITELKQKIAEVMAVMPGITYAVATPISPHFISKYLDSENS
ncbi:macoilin-like [Protopterus annectens]|uniref:macoilin-like n=1 Tax=Protopterus annectens TaxID=7888 RepID=UPI001CFB8F9A|nr:macoilin-like [Protopterus annectens]